MGTLRRQCVSPARLLACLLNLVVFCLAAACSRSPDGEQVDSSSPIVVRIHEQSVRTSALSAALPAYPIQSTACGVAVAAFELQPDGQVLTRTILEAPDEDTRRSLEQALETWRFRPIGDAQDTERGVVFSGKVTFYFVNFSGRPEDGWVVAGLDAPNISRCTSRTSDVPRVAGVASNLPKPA